MYGILLRLDSGRQRRVGVNCLQKLISAKTLAKLESRRTKLNASTAVTSPFAPTLVRPSFYPELFRATDIKSLFWKVKNMNSFHTLKRVFVHENGNIVFEFWKEGLAEGIDLAKELGRFMKSCAHDELINPKNGTAGNCKTVTFEYAATEYSLKDEDDE